MSVSIEEPLPSLGRRRDDESSSDDVISTHAKDLYDTKTTSKVIRVLTVLAYLLSVSFAAILLSVYYIFIWDPPRNHGPTAAPLLQHENSTHAAHLWSAAAAAVSTQVAVPGDLAVSAITAVSTPASAPADDVNNHTDTPAPQPYSPVHADLLENQTNFISKNTSKRKRGRDPS